MSAGRRLDHLQQDTIKWWWGCQNGIGHCITPHLCWLLNLEWYIILWARSPLSLEHIPVWYPLSEPSMYLHPHAIRNMRRLNKKGNRIKGGGVPTLPCLTLPYRERERIPDTQHTQRGVVVSCCHQGGAWATISSEARHGTAKGKWWAGRTA